MERTEDVVFLSDEVSECFKSIIDISSKYYSYDETIERIGRYILFQEPNPYYDYIVEQFPHVSKSLVFGMLLGNFLEITHYRQEMGIKLDSKREEVYNVLLGAFQMQHNVTIRIPYAHFCLLLNDVCCYLNHPSPLYQQTVVSTFYRSEFENIVEFYDCLAPLSHVLLSQNSVSPKEEVYYTVVEAASDALELFVFSKHAFDSPFFMPDNLRQMTQVLRELPEEKRQKNKFYHSVIRQVQARLSFNQGEDERKIALLECVLAGIYEKDSSVQTEFEQMMVESMTKEHMTSEFLSTFYDEHEEDVLKIFLLNFSVVSKESQLKDLKLFDEVCHRGGRQYRKE